jgi:serine-type D-Ala-D-Ala carboxypeptidase/endopeptidase
MRLLPGSLLLLSLASAVAQTSVQIPPPLPAVMTLHDLNEAAPLGEDLYNNSGATGLVLVVVRGNQVFFHGYGETAPGSQTAPSEDSVLRLCSLTKTFTADILAKLAADGVVHLDDPLERFAPQGVVLPSEDAAITLEELATHTSGLTREIGTAPRKTPHFTYPDYETRWHWLESAQVKFTPGTQALYSNVGFDLLSDALAAAAHTSYATLLEARTLKPLQMWETTYYPSLAQCARLMQTAHHEGPCTITENTEGSSGLYSTPADMAKWLHYLVGLGTPTLPEHADSAQAVYVLPSSLTTEYGLSHAGRPTGIGLGWLHLGTNTDASHIIEKTGGGAGFTTYIAIHPASHTALFVAATDGPYGWKPGFNLFKASNNALLALAGLPPFPEHPRQRVAARHIRRTPRLVRVKKSVAAARVTRVAQQGSANGSENEH